MPPGYAVHRPNLAVDPNESGLTDGWNLGDPVNNLVLGVKGTNGTIVNGPVVGQTPLGMAMRFNGTSSYIDYGIWSNFGTGDYTIEAWFQPNDTATVKMIFSQDNGGNPLVTLYMSAGEILVYVCRDVLASLVNINSGIAVAGRYVHVAVTRVGTAHTLYQDGNQVAAGVGAGASVTSGGRDTVGADYNAGIYRYWFDGFIGPYVKIYRGTALAANIIRAHYNAAKSACFKTHSEEISVDPIAIGGTVGMYL